MKRLLTFITMALFCFNNILAFLFEHGINGLFSLFNTYTIVVSPFLINFDS